MRGSSVLAVGIVVLLCSSGCGEPPVVAPDGGVLPPDDAGVETDGGTTREDAGLVDQDAGVTHAQDGGSEDAGAGEEDAGTQVDEDAGIQVDEDAGTDAGTQVDEDAGTDLDAGIPDAGTDDAGVPQDAGTPPVDPCSTAMPVCPIATAVEGGGLVPIDRCAFPIEEAAAFATAPPLIAALETLTTPVTLTDVLGDLNRTATAALTVPGNPPGVSFAIRWNTEDDQSSSWTPQGISGSPDATATGLYNGKRLVLASWYHAPSSGTNKGVRVSFLDATQPALARYRHVLLVVPTGTPQAPDFQPLLLHAGGIAWYGDLLYVADTSRGFRVFDLRRILRVATDPALTEEVGCTATRCLAGNYKYVLPQVGAYESRSTCGPRFSFVSLDRQSSPPALVSGEYCSTTACPTALAGRVFRWPIDPLTGRLMATRSWPRDVNLMGQRQVQGAATRSGVYYLSSSAPSGTAGALYCVTATRSATSTWNSGPEDLMIDLTNNLLYSHSEYSPRVVFAARLSSYPAP